MKKWTYEKCYEVAKKYATNIEFRTKNISVYQTACKNNWLKDYTWFKSRHDLCLETAKKYKTKAEFRKKDRSILEIARRNNWLKDYTWLFTIKPAGYWNYENCFNEAMKYKTRWEFQQGNNSAYRPAILNKWIDDYKWMKPSQKSDKFNYQDCFNEAKKYTRRGEFQQGNLSLYNAAYRYKWINDYTWLNGPKHSRRYWTYDRCYDMAKNCKTNNEFYQLNKSAWQAAYKNKWLDDYNWFTNLKHHIRQPWTYEKCYEVAKKYKTKTEFRKGYSGAHAIAYKNQWLDKFFPKNNLVVK